MKTEKWRFIFQFSIFRCRNEKWTLKPMFPFSWHRKLKFKTFLDIQVIVIQCTCVFLFVAIFSSIMEGRFDRNCVKLNSNLNLLYKFDKCFTNMEVNAIGNVDSSECLNVSMSRFPIRVPFPIRFQRWWSNEQEHLDSILACTRDGLKKEVQWQTSRCNLCYSVSIFRAKVSLYGRL